jgi:steroid delta-isomerase-like uncharacterized protein
MRKVSFALAIGFVLVACGGGEENPAPKTPATPPEAMTPPAPPATAEAPKEEPKETAAELQQKTVKGFIEAMNAHDAKKVAGFYSEGGVVKIAGAPADASGREAIAQSYEKLFQAFNDFKTAPTKVFMKGDVVAVEWVFNGTHTGDLYGIKATEKKAGAQGFDVMWFSPEGLIKEHHVYYDGATVLSQIGVSKAKARPIPAMPSGAPAVVTGTGSADETKNLDLLKGMHAALEGKKEADFTNLVADTAEYDDMTQPQGMKGKPDAKKFYKEVTTGFPDVKFTVSNAWGFGDVVVSEVSWTGTHKGSFFGIAPTKKTVNTKSVSVMQVKDGKMVKGWAYANGADFAMQLGLMPKPGEAKPGDKKAAEPKAGDTKGAAAPTGKPAVKAAAPAAAPKK